MKILHTKIGEHIIHFENAPRYLFKMFRELEDENHQPDLTVTIQLDFGIPFVNDDVKENRQADRIYYRRSDYLMEVDAAFQYAEISAYDELALKHALFNLYSSFIVYHGWGLLLHSSCVIENGKAHMFAGHSGAGKSTAAKLSLPRNLLADEATIVKISSEKIEVFNSPFRSEIPSDGENGIFPLGSIQVLHQSLQNQRVRLTKSDSLITLIDKVFYWSSHPADKKMILGLLLEMASQVPVYNLFFLNNDTFWELIS
ncbi:hypothetical protein ACQKGI_02620 [Peribacillus muralis]|uniref:hypothetical protein n=1 Tax=Peribacillus muralis TaxID=264697 RepID=UPI003814F523